jgi:hypothetical protein
MIDIVIIRSTQAETGGGQWREGGTYSASESYAKALIGRGDAYAPGGEIVDIGGGIVGDGLAPGSYGDIIATGDPTTGLNISSSVLTAAARTVVDDATVGAMVDTLGGASATGSGGLVRATSPTLVTPILGTPQSVTLTNGTSLPISTGISGLGTGVATFLAAPSSANLRAALTDETGTGAAVFANGPTLVGPVLGTPASGTLTNCTGLPVAGLVGLTTVATDVIFDAAGDLVVGTGANTSARLAIGGNGNVLRSTGSTAAWAALAAADISIADAGGYFSGTSIEAALQEMGALVDDIPVVAQFGVVHSGLMVQPYRVTATGTPAGLSGPCLVESIMCLTVGTGGPVTIHDDVDAATAAQLRFTRAVGDMVAGTVYPLAGDGAAVVFTNGLYFTNSTSGVYIINAVPEV